MNLNQATYMSGLTILHLRFRAEAVTTVRFDAQPGSALRGALYAYMRDHYCSDVSGFAGDDHQETCPVCLLLAQEDEERIRGRNPPRALTLQPPASGVIAPKQRFTFGITLIGKAQRLMIFLLRAAAEIGQQGVGIGRGRFKVIDIEEYSPLLDVGRSLTRDQSVLRSALYVDAKRIDEQQSGGFQRVGDATPSGSTLTLKFITPMRLIDQGVLVKRPDAGVIMQRLIERCQELHGYFGEGEQQPREAWVALMQGLCDHARTLTTTYDDTVWIEAWSGSKRQPHLTPISGFTGVVRWEGEAAAVLRPWLLWGQSLHVGKDAVKGNGWYTVLA